MTIVHDKYSRGKKAKQPRVMLWITVSVLTVLALFVGGSLIAINRDSQIRTAKYIVDVVDAEFAGEEAEISSTSPQIQRLRGTGNWETPEWKAYIELNKPYWRKGQDEKLADLKSRLDTIHWIDAHWNATAAYDSYKAYVEMDQLDPTRRYGITALALYTEEACRHGKYAEGWENLETWKLSDRMHPNLIVPSDTVSEAESYAIAEKAFKSALLVSRDMSC